MPGGGFAVDASLISTDANKARSIVAEDRSPEVAREAGNRAAREYLETLDDAAFRAASPTQPKFVAKSDPAAQWTRAEESRPYFSYATNDLIDTKSSVITYVATWKGYVYVAFVIDAQPKSASFKPGGRLRLPRRTRGGDHALVL